MCIQFFKNLKVPLSDITFIFYDSLTYAKFRKFEKSFFIILPTHSMIHVFLLSSLDEYNTKLDIYIYSWINRHFVILHTNSDYFFMLTKANTNL